MLGRMDAHTYIKQKQIQWARRKGLSLTGSKGDHRGAQAYTRALDDNLFEPLSSEAKQQFENGDGQELTSSTGPGKMQAVHSSSAIGVNVFHYWQTLGQVGVIAKACGLPASSSGVIRFEAQYPIDRRFRFSPNIDVVIVNGPRSKQKVSAIECKFTEAYGQHEHGGLKPAYLKLESIWNGLPALHELATALSPRDASYRHLHPAQLVKHILGLKQAYGKLGFRLCYLWYDTLGRDGARHREEVERFTVITEADGVAFQALTYQELLLTLIRRHQDGHGSYVNYLAGRYL